MKTILHVIQQMSKGGASRALLALIDNLPSKKYSNRIISLLSIDSSTQNLIREYGLDVIEAPSELSMQNESANADVVHFHWWNNGELYELIRSDLPAMRALTWYHVAGDSLPHLMTDELINFPDVSVACTAYSSFLPVFSSTSSKAYESVKTMVLAGADFSRIKLKTRRSRKFFNVGYIGTVHKVKMHRNYISMSDKVNVPNIKFVICGSGMIPEFEQQARDLDSLHKFEFKGWVDDISPVLSELDVYGYPVNEDTFAAAELNLQEAMYAGVPPVIFPHGGIKYLVEDGKTGLVAHNETEYKEAIEYLYFNPKERMQLGKNAHQVASKEMGAKNSALYFETIYDELIRLPKTKKKYERFKIILNDKQNESLDLSGAHDFIDTLRHASTSFLASINAKNIDELLNADGKIANSSMLFHIGDGGIHYYHLYYPRDAYLAFWSGLVYLKVKQYKKAISLFETAKENGFMHSRLTQYLDVSKTALNHC